MNGDRAIGFPGSRGGRANQAASTLLVLAGLVTADLDGASADPSSPQRATLRLDLRTHLGDSTKREGTQLAGFPSLVLGGELRVLGGWGVEGAVSHATVTAEWENIGGWSSAYLGVRLRRGGWRFAAGVAAPLDRSLPAPACFGATQGGDSQTYRFGAAPACWDRSAYRRAALHRGMWDAWMWAPDWITGAVTAEARAIGGAPWLTLAAGLGVALPSGDRHDGAAVVTQLAVRAHRAIGGPKVLFGRLIAAGSFAGDTSPFLFSAEVGLRSSLGPVFGQIVATLPMVDLRNDRVPPGRGGYVPAELWSLQTMGGITF